MDILVSDKLISLLMISITYSIILMAVVQKVKTLVFITESWHIWFVNFFLAFIVGIPFSLSFYSLDIFSSIWVSVFGFVGAPGIYEALKKQNIINYTPSSSNVNKVNISVDNEIKRDDL